MSEKVWTWTRGRTQVLIEKVKYFPELWNTTAHEFKDKIKKHNAIITIAKDFNTSEEEVKRKIHNLRTQFGQEVKKAEKKKSGKSCDGTWHSKWEFFDAMKYMMCSYMSRETRDNSARGNDILGLSGNTGSDGLPYTTLSYANGLGYYNTYSGKGPRRDLSRDNLKDADYRYMATVPLSSETHGGEDVGVFAVGPKSELFSGNYEQTSIPLMMAYAAKIGPYTDRKH